MTVMTEQYQAVADAIEKWRKSMAQLIVPRSGVTRTDVWRNASAVLNLMLDDDRSLVDIMGDEDAELILNHAAEWALRKPEPQY